MEMIGGAGMSSDWTVRVGNAERLPEVLQSLGLDASAVLRNAGVPSDAFDNPEGALSLEAVDDLLHQVETQSGCDHFGLLVGRLPADLGLPSYLFFNAPDLRAGIEDLVASIALINKGGCFGLEQHSDVATVRYTTFAPLRYANHLSDCVLAQLHGVLVRYCGPRFRALEVRLPRRRSTEVSLYRAHFGPARLVFDATEAAIDFPASLLGYSSPLADPELYRFLKRTLHERYNPALEPLGPRLRRMLGRLILDGDLSIERVARLFGQSPRQLNERLKSEGASFHNMVKDARFVAALQMLKHTDLPIGAIAVTLQYADASAFTRAVRKRTGMTPGEWRAGQPGVR